MVDRFNRGKPAFISVIIQVSIRRVAVPCLRHFSFWTAWDVSKAQQIVSTCLSTLYEKFLIIFRNKVPLLVRWYELTCLLAIFQSAKEICFKFEFQEFQLSCYWQIYQNFTKLLSVWYNFSHLLALNRFLVADCHAISVRWNAKMLHVRTCIMYTYVR